MTKKASGKKKNTPQEEIVVPSRLHFVQTRIIQIRTALLNANPTVSSISIDGDSTAYSVEQAEKLLQKYELEEQYLSGNYSPIERIDMTRI